MGCFTLQRQLRVPMSIALCFKNAPQGCLRKQQGEKKNCEFSSVIALKWFCEFNATWDELNLTYFSITTGAELLLSGRTEYPSEFKALNKKYGKFEFRM